MSSYWGFPLQSENRPPMEAPGEGSVMVLSVLTGTSLGICRSFRGADSLWTWQNWKPFVRKNGGKSLDQELKIILTPILATRGAIRTWRGIISVRLVWSHLLIIGQFSSKCETVPVIKHEYLEEMYRFMPDRRTIKLLLTDNSDINTHTSIFRTFMHKQVRIHTWKQRCESARALAVSRHLLTACLCLSANRTSSEDIYHPAASSERKMTSQHLHSHLLMLFLPPSDHSCSPLHLLSTSFPPPPLHSRHSHPSLCVCVFLPFSFFFYRHPFLI